MSWYKRANDDYEFDYEDLDNFDPMFYEDDRDFKEFNIHSSEYPDVVESMMLRIKNKDFKDINYNEFKMFNFYHPAEAKKLVIEATKEAIEKDVQYGIINGYFGMDYPDEIEKLISNFFVIHGRFPFFMDFYATIAFREKHLKEFENFDLNEIKKWIEYHHPSIETTKELISFWYYMWLGSGNMPGDVTKYLHIHFNPDASYVFLPRKAQIKFDAEIETYGGSLDNSHILDYKKYQGQIMKNLVYYAFINGNMYVKHRVIKRLYDEENTRVRIENLREADYSFSNTIQSAVISKRLRSYINNLIDSRNAPPELLKFEQIGFDFNFSGITKKQTEKLDEINSLKEIISQNTFDKITSYVLMIRAVKRTYKNYKNNR